MRLRSKMVFRIVRSWPLCLQCLHLVHRIPSIRALLRVFHLRNGMLLRQRDIILTFPSSLTTTCILASLLLDCHVFSLGLCASLFLGSWVLVSDVDGISILVHRILLHCNHISDPWGNTRKRNVRCDRRSAITGFPSINCQISRSTNNASPLFFTNKTVDKRVPYILSPVVSNSS